MQTIRKKALSLFLAFSMVLGSCAGLNETKARAATLANHVVINEIFGGGGTSGAPTNDYIELYNPTGSSVDLTGWSVQYASKAGTSWQTTALSGSIPSCGYYLVQESGSAGSSLSSPDAAGNINLSATAGKVALASGTTGIKDSGDSAVVDFVAYGVGASPYAGTGPTPAPSSTTSVARTPDGQDTNNNAADFRAGTPTPKNSSASGGQGNPGDKDSNVTFNPPAPGGTATVTKGSKVVLSGAGAGQVICYRINGGDVQVYQNPISINEDTTVAAWICTEGEKDSQFALGDISTATYHPESIDNIGQARKAGSGKSVTLTGVALCAYNSSASSLGLYMQDDTGGIMLYGDSVLKGANIQPGDIVQATGTTSDYTSSNPHKFELNVTSVTVTGHGSVPSPTAAALSAIGEAVGGKLIKISGATVSNLTEDSYHGASFTLTQSGKTLGAKLDNRRGLYSDFAVKVKNGQTADITGILEGYDGNYILQLLSADAVSNVQDSLTVASVTATPGSNSAAKVGDTVTLACATADAVIHYSLDPKASDDQYLIYDSHTPITLSSLPATLMAYATKAGMDASGKSVFTYQQQYDGKYNIYFGQLHSHTNLSDGVGTVDQAFDHASQVKNLDFLAVTDHSNYFETPSQATSTPPANNIQDGSNSASWKTGRGAASAVTGQNIPNTDNVTDPSSTFLGIYGYEMTWSDGSGHINTFNTPGFEDRQNTYFCNKTQSASNPIGLKNYYDTLEKVPQSISQFNHPGTTFGDFYDFANYSPAYDQLLDLVEVGNGEGPVRGAGYFPSYEYYTRALDKGWHVAPTNNQDNHKGNWGDSNTARSVILAPSLTEANLYDALRNRRVYATEDNDLSIRYTVNGAVMGSEISVPQGDNLSIEAQLSDPTDAQIGKVEVIVNGGRVAASKVLTANSGTVGFTIPNQYSYYYLRVTEPDKDIAVTAPVWTGSVEKAGITSVNADTTLPVKGETCNITTGLYNNESSSMTVESLEYKTGDTVIQLVTGDQLSGGADVSSLGTKTYSFPFTPKFAGTNPISVTMKAELGGVERTYTSSVTLQVADPATVTKVLIDGTHANDYVDGYYEGNMGNITQIAATEGTQVRVETNRITPDMLKSTQMLVVTAPAKSSGTTKGGTAYQPQTFSDDFIQMVRDYVKGGGTVAVCGLSDYSDGPNDPYTSSTQVNALLAGIGAKSTISNDEVCDQAQNGGQSYRLYLQNFNMDSPYLKGVVSSQQYSFYSGCSVTPGGDAQWLVKGFGTTYSINSKASNGKYEAGVPVSSATSSYDAAKAVKKQGDVCALAEEDVGSGHVVISGAVFLSDFEIKADVDNNWDLPYANKTIAENLMNSIKVAIPTTSIANVRENGQTGDVFAVEGTVTAGSEQPNAFTDTVYLQDATGGIDVYPIANGSGIQAGQKLRVVGHVDAYQGDKELKIGSGVEGYQVIDSTVNPIAPSSLAVADALNYEKNGGLLVRTQGTVSNIQLMGGTIQSFLLTSGGKSIRVLINGYISPNVDLTSTVKNGASVTAVGLVYTDPDGVCLRVRDRNEIQTVPDSGSGKSDRSSSPSQTAPSATDPVVTTTQENGKTSQTIITKISAPPLIAGGRADLAVSIPDTAALAAANATPQAPVEVRIVPPHADLIAQLGNSLVQDVVLKIQAPAALVSGTNPNVKVIISLPAEVLASLSDTQKKITVSVADSQSGKVLYSWSFSGQTGASPAAKPTDIDLSLSVQSTQAGSSRTPVSSEPGVVLRFADNGMLPRTANVRVYVGNQPGAAPNSSLYLYSLDSVSGVLQRLRQKAYPVDADGYVDIGIAHCSQYVLLPSLSPNAYPVYSDTTFPVDVKQGGAYTFGITSETAEEPKFSVGNGQAFHLTAKRVNGKYFITAQAAVSAGTTALYSTLPGKKPVLICYLTATK